MPETSARLTAAPGAAGPRRARRLEPGFAKLEPADALAYVPAAPADPAPLAVMLHGSGSAPRSGLAPLLRFADDAGLVLVAPASRRYTWDVILGGFGPDVKALDALLDEVFGRLDVDPARVALGGFSDGASYALSLGLPNVHLFTHLIAFSPGFVVTDAPRECPAVYVSHGAGDPVLPIDRCGRRVVTTLRDRGCAVEYDEFEGGHAVPREVAFRAVRWLLESE